MYPCKTSLTNPARMKWVMKMLTSYDLDDEEVPQRVDFQEGRHAKCAHAGSAGEHAEGQELAQMHAIRQMAHPKHAQCICAQECHIQLPQQHPPSGLIERSLHRTPRVSQSSCLRLHALQAAQLQLHASNIEMSRTACSRTIPSQGARASAEGRAGRAWEVGEDSAAVAKVVEGEGLAAVARAVEGRATACSMGVIICHHLHGRGRNELAMKQADVRASGSGNRSNGLVHCRHAYVEEQCQRMAPSSSGGHPSSEHDLVRQSWVCCALGL